MQWCPATRDPQTPGTLAQKAVKVRLWWQVSGTPPGCPLSVRQKRSGVTTGDFRNGVATSACTSKAQSPPDTDTVLGKFKVVRSHTDGKQRFILHPLLSGRDGHSPCLLPSMDQASENLLRVCERLDTLPSESKKL